MSCTHDCMQGRACNCVFPVAFGAARPMPACARRPGAAPAARACTEDCQDHEALQRSDHLWVGGVWVVSFGAFCTSLYWLLHLA